MSAKQSDNDAKWDVMCYEVFMYRAMQLHRKTKAENRTVLNAYVECELLHVRNLVEAFQVSEGKGDDIKLHRLVADQMTDELAAAIGRLGIAYFTKHRRGEFPKEEIEKRIVHMTTKRADATGHEYDECFAVMEPAIERVLRAIVAIRGEWCSDLAQFVAEPATLLIDGMGSTSATTGNVPTHHA